jgi:hypothetical protein
VGGREETLVGRNKYPGRISSLSQARKLSSLGTAADFLFLSYSTLHMTVVVKAKTK